MKWAHTVLSCGFRVVKKLSHALLGGADPAIIADLLDIELSSADAKIIGKKNHGKNRIDNKDKFEKNMTKAELKVECTKAKLPHGGTTNELTTRLEIYQSVLSKVVDGLIKGEFSISGILPKGWRYEGHNNNGRGGQWLISRPRRLSWRLSPTPMDDHPRTKSQHY